MAVSLSAQRWMARLIGVLAFAGVLVATSGALHGLDGITIESPSNVLCLAGLLVGGELSLERWLVVRATRVLDHAIASSSPAEARRRYDDLVRGCGAQWAKSVGACAALSTILLLERNYAEARRMLLSLPLARMQPRYRTQLLNNLAIATMEAGDATEAIAIAKQSLDCAPAGTPPEDIAINTTTLAEALVRAGRHAEALPLLEDGLSRPRRKSDRAWAALVFGDALAGVGRTVEAAEAYRRACSEYPSGRSAQRARERLANLEPYRS